MIRANNEAAIEAKKKEIQETCIKIEVFTTICVNLLEQIKELYQKHEDLNYELEELKDAMQNNDFQA